jgi:predicted PhzF superfamily epimerase YddE/YHI9
MKLTMYQVDAFASAVFKGNPAAIVPLTQWLDDAVMQNIAAENNLAETAFFVPVKDGAADYIIFNNLGFTKETVVFTCQSGLLRVTQKDDLLQMDFPAWKPKPINDAPAGIAEILGVKNVIGTYRYRDLLIEVASEEDVIHASPDFTALKKTNEMVILTSAGKQVDFVSRFFAPNAGVDEDPVTGSAHSQLIPFWSEKLKRKKMFAKQLSKREGELWCEDLGERVLISGKCAFYMQAEIVV